MNGPKAAMLKRRLSAVRCADAPCCFKPEGEGPGFDPWRTVLVEEIRTIVEDVDVDGFPPLQIERACKYDPQKARVEFRQEFKAVEEIGVSLISRMVASVVLCLLPGCTTAPAEERQACMPTEADALGPYYVADTPVVDDLNRHGKPGDPLTLAGRILSSVDSEPISGASIEIWQTDGDGVYHPDANGAYGDYDDEAIDLRGTVISDRKGGYRVKTVVPGAYFPRPRHFHYRITAADHQPLVTQLYLTGDDAAGRPDDDCRHARLETTADGLLYAAPDIFLIKGE